jgi:hypothetical protein
MKTVTISPFAERHSAWWFHAGFTETYNTGKCGAESAEDVTPTVLKWIEQNGKDVNWFLHDAPVLPSGLRQPPIRHSLSARPKE